MRHKFNMRESERLGSQWSQTRAGETATAAPLDTVNYNTLGHTSNTSFNKMPNLFPQKTNVLTGATTQYYSNQRDIWMNDYEDLVKFQRIKQIQEIHEESLRPQPDKMRNAKSQKPDKFSMPVRGRTFAA